MSKLLLFACCILMCNVLCAQSGTKEYYLGKSKRQKTTGWILLGTGTAAIVSGLLIEAPNRGTGNSQSYTGGFLEVGGILSALTSIPFFIGSSKNKKKATTLAISTQRILQPRQNSIVLQGLPTVSIMISLESR